MPPRPLRPEVRARRVGAASKSTQVQDTVQWYGLKSRIPRAPTAYPNVTVAAVTVTGGDRLAAQVENQISAWATRKLPRSTALSARHGTLRRRSASPQRGLLRIGHQHGRAGPAARRMVSPWRLLRRLSRRRLDRQASAERYAWGRFAELTCSVALSRRSGTNRVRRSTGTRSAGRTSSRVEPRKIDPDVHAGRPLRWGRCRVSGADSWQWLLVKCRLPGDAGIRPKKVRVQGKSHARKRGNGGCAPAAS